MRLYLKKDNSTDLSRFVVLNELGDEKYYVVKRRDYPHGSRIITTLDYNKVCSITSIPLPLMKAYTLNDSKDIVRLVFSKNIARFMCYYYGISWRFRGDILQKNYEIVDHDNTVMLSHINHWAKGNKGYEINIFDEEREMLLLASAICIDQFETAEKKQLIRV